MEILNNPTLQTILGVSLGWLLSLTSSKPQKEFRDLTIIETKINIEKIYVKPNSKDNLNDPLMMMVILFVIALYAIFNYIKYNVQIFEYVKLYEFIILFFMLTIIFFSIINKNITSKEWISQLTIPIAIFFITILLFNYLEVNINHKIIDLANNSEIMDFVKSLTPYGMKFLSFQLISFSMTLSVSFLSLFYFINYFSLINLRVNKPKKIWYFIYKHTRINSKFYYVLSVMFLSAVTIIQSDWFKATVLKS